MKYLPLLFVLFFLIAVESKHFSQLGWNLLSAQIEPDHPISFKVYLKHENLDLLSEKVKLVSDPKSTEYTNYLTAREILDIIEPKLESSNYIKDWIQSYNPIILDDSFVDVLRVTMNIVNAESMFNLKFDKFEHPHRNGYIIRSKEDPIIDKKLMEHIDLITGISHFPIVKKALKSKESFISSQEPTNGLNILGFKGTGETGTLKYTPSCSPSCNDKYYPVNVYYSPNNVQLNFTINTFNITPQCQAQSQGYPICTVVIQSVPYIPSTISILDTVTEDKATYPFSVVSTPPVTPASIKSYYGIPAGYAITTNITQSVAEFEDQFINLDDLSLFFREMGLPNNYQVEFIGPNNISNPGVEASLDIQYIMGIAPGAKTYFWSTYSNSTYTNEGVDDILSFVTAVFNTEASQQPLVNSISYGISEEYVDQFLGNGYLSRSDIEFQKAALTGLTFVVSSGDTGAGSLGSQPPLSQSCSTSLNPAYPSQSPYVTSVGALYFTPLSQPICYGSINNGSGTNCINQPIGEVGVSVDYSMSWTSGGGYSFTAPRPWYQDDLANIYMNDYNYSLPPSNLFNTSGRIFPDLSAIGHNLGVYVDGQLLYVDGTSASAPITAGLFTILNDIRIKNNLKPIGFANPLLYQIAKDYPSAFYDVTVGNNRCGAINMANVPTCCNFGFNAVPGYDAVSGIGRINMEVLMNIITQY